MSERATLILEWERRWQAGVDVAELCRRFGGSRQTGYVRIRPHQAAGHDVAAVERCPRVVFPSVAPAAPQQNGRLERESDVAPDQRAQRRVFDTFRGVSNGVRPHAALAHGAADPTSRSLRIASPPTLEDAAESNEERRHDSATAASEAAHRDRHATRVSRSSPERHPALTLALYSPPARARSDIAAATSHDGRGERWW